MANSFAIVPGNRGVPFVRSPGLIHLTFTCGATYATATGGLAVDLTSLVSATAPILGLNPPTLTAGDLIGGFGFSTLGHVCVLTPVAATPGTYTMRMWNGTTEIADGAKTNVIDLYVLTN